jgi:calcineurin-like phosphoesterase family protein
VGIVELPRIWFTSDQHFGHENIIKFCHRPYDTVCDMDEDLIDCWNQSIAPHEKVYHLGDFTLGTEAHARSYFRRLNGDIRILGTAWHHDSRWLPIWNLLDAGPHAKVGTSSFFSGSSLKVKILPPLHVLEFHELGTGKYPLAITLCHYPLAVWDRSHYGAWCLHGHEHQRHRSKLDGYIFNVGVDVNNYAPVLLADIVDRMMEKGWKNPRCDDE